MIKKIHIAGTNIHFFIHLQRMSQLNGLKLLHRLANNCQRIQFIHTQPKKRFYKNVSVVQANGKYEINLDHRKLKTPLGSPLLVIKFSPNLTRQWSIFGLQISNESLANAVANEWMSQKKEINLNQMHINGTRLHYTLPATTFIKITS